MPWVLGCFLFQSISTILVSQPLPQRFLDKNWMYYNMNVHAQTGFGVGYDLTGGMDETYVKDILFTDLMVYHTTTALHLKRLSVLDMKQSPNDRYNRFVFDDTTVLSLSEVLIYLGGKYANFSTFQDFRMALFSDSTAYLIQSMELKNSRKFLLEEWLFYDADSNRWYRHLGKIGIVSPRSENNEDIQVLWMNYEQVDPKAMARVRFMPIGTHTDFWSLIKKWPFATIPLELGETKLFDSDVKGRHIRHLEAPGAARLINEIFEKEQSGVIPPGKLKKRKYKSTHLSGNVDDGKMYGIWELRGMPDGRAIVSFDAGEPSGFYKLFDAEGNKTETGQMKYGLITDTVFQWYAEGGPSAQLIYTEGKLHGEVFFFYPDGKIKAKAKYLRGVAEGAFEHYYHDGNIMIRGNFKEGKVFDVWEYNIRLPRQPCGYLNDSEAYGMGFQSAVPGAYRDCIATYNILYEHRRIEGCVDGICVIPSLQGTVK